MRKHVRKVVFAAAAIVIAGSVGATIGSANSGKAGTAKAGGTYRVGWEAEFGWTDAFDPTGEYLGNAWALYSNLLVRTLVGYNHVSGAAGNKLVPDLATSLPKPTNGGKTFTFHLKNGIKFAPPVNREITSKDIAYAINRLANPKNGGQYAFYYTDIVGWANGAKGKPVSGIKTPNAKTLVINLTAPSGDLFYRLAMPATGPIPAEVAKCFTGGDANKYGRDLVASGPYMFEGSDKVSIGSCSAIKPASGYDGQTNMTLVRNPNYKASTDSKAARENNPDSFVFTVNTNADDIWNKVQSGDLDDAVASPTPKVLRQYQTSSDLKSRLKINSGDRTWYITMNLTQPPFDDIHVRKAMNWIIDKNGLRKGWGGPTVGAIANHIVPDPLLNNVLKSYKPYGTPGDAGSVSKAQAEMKKSKYSGGSGSCTAKQCKNVLMIADVRAVDKAMIPIIQADAKKIGITFKVRSVNGAYPVIQTPSKNIPISERPGWGKDYADASTFFNALFASTSILASGNTNYSLVGLKPSMAGKFGIKGTTSGIPSVDSDITKCNQTQAASAEGPNARIKCWAGVDRKLMTQVVPWVPYLSASNINIIGPNVTKWNYDQFSDQTAYAHVAVK